MKKILTLTIGLLLSTIVSAQVPFEVEKEIRISTSGDTTVHVSNSTNVSFKMTSDLNHAKFVFENRDFDLKIKSKKLDIVDYEKVGDGIDGLRIYTLESDELGSVIMEEELKSMTGKIKIDRNKDGVFEEILVLK